MSGRYSKSVYCILCGNREKSVSYHAFPKQEKIRKQWLAFCGIDETILNTATRICSNHFCEEMKKKTCKGVVLQPNAIPSMHIKKTKMREQSNSVCNEVCTKQKHIVTDNVNIHCNISVTDTSMIVDTQCALQSYNNAQLSKCPTPPKAQSCVGHIGTSDSAMTAKRLSQVTNSGSVTDVASVRDATPMRDTTPVRDATPMKKATMCSNWQTPTKTVHNPRFVSEIRTPHLATPKRARRCLQLAKWTIAQQQRKIKTLQQARKRLVARVTTMKDLIKHLKKKNFISEAAAENLQVSKTNVSNCESVDISFYCTCTADLCRTK